ncbi:MAG: phosphate ABC transporter substrate-binding/OmpA family protein [Pseudomonadota bacterium]
MDNPAKKALLVSTILAAAASPALAEIVTLKTTDGSVSVSGDLLSFDNDFYVLQTAVGQMAIAASNVSCEGAACPELKPTHSEFTIAGSKSLGDKLIPALAIAYGSEIGGTSEMTEAENAKVVNIAANEQGTAAIEIKATDTRQGFNALLAGEADFALASRPIRNREIRALEEAGKANPRAAGREHIVALDGLLLVTHPENPVRAISEVNAALAFAGRIGSWVELGGRNAPINLYVRENDSGSREVFDTLLMRPNGLSIGGNVQVMESDAAIAEAVRNDPNGLGFTSFANASNAAALDIEGVCGLRTPATAFTIKTEEYPLTRLLYMYEGDNGLQRHARDFLSFVNSEEGQEQVARAGFIDQSISSETINSQGIRVASAVVNNTEFNDFLQMQDMFGLLLASDRLSTTYRFETGSARLDARGQADIDRLSEILSDDRFANKEVLFVGFTDSVGREDLNQVLSQQRAEQVRRTILDANPALASRIRTRSVGFGEVSPLGCNETDQGRRINRRVEVWVKDIAAADQN